jgi:hypothetical protein
MYLVKNHELIFVAGKVSFRVGELGAVCTALKVKIYRVARIADFLRECGLADLTRPE